MNKGAVWSNRSGKKKRLRRAKSVLPVDSEISIYYSPIILATEPEEPELIEDKGEFSVWSKPPGLLSNGSRFADHCAINRVVEKILDRPTFLVHRLDKYVWGLMVLAHTKKCAANLSHQFQQRQTKKIYKAILIGNLKDPVTINRPLDHKTAVTHVTPFANKDNKSLVKVRIETGRKHQIRRHLSDIGHPIVGDRLYGTSKPESELQLASISLSFRSMTGKVFHHDLRDEQHPSL